ncbi:cystathionine beta-lyase family protein involved in aluminum resistance [Gracilibacillus halotolerans]|uniref:Cystathionine beta-lyase family protein involved in aluminum resistance n=1 Tax=Gracilibacillus halotolerans TaxID=74386 RepID=A0A841RC70_9BACI|nr:methionine gamma-lyase family protein [Gracilibacillus halotolerans]MBB6511520.1 cystathionine beta-lyase family protein involved in aluminum resistance [Gracilibacillus halotolerans]
MTNSMTTINIEKKLEPIFNNISEIEKLNQEKVLQAFRDHSVSDSDFNPTTGYGYDDYGRDKLERVYASIFGAEDALVRPQIVSGTHAITIALFGVLRPGDELMYITGEPYDTLTQVIGARSHSPGSLTDFGVLYQSIPLHNEKVDLDAVKAKMSEKTKVIAIQRSKGYDERPSITIHEMEEIIRTIKSWNKDIIIFVDNCYGEFVEAYEPTDIGADIIAGSLIKNPGGGIARSGGYIVGKNKLVELASYHLTAPGIGKEIGASIGMLQEMYQGIFLAPHVVSEALKGAIFTSAYLEEMGFQTSPKYNDFRTDLIQSVNFHSAEEMIAFCQEIQKYSPINSHVLPYPAPMPGYEDEVIMAAGTFIQGASLELTADGPIRPPYTAFVQGGLTYQHVKIAVTNAIQAIRTIE